MTAGPWYQRYFGSDYLRIYRLADTAEQIAFLRDLLRHSGPPGRLLDLPCGHGRHAVEIAGWGWQVTGLDLSPPFLQVAAQAAGAAGRPVRLVRGDMRCFPLASATFEVSICMFTSLGYFDEVAENARVLREFWRVTRPGGRFVLDLANIDFVRQQAPRAEWSKDGVTVRSEYLWSEATRRAVTRRWATFDDGRAEQYESSVRLFEGAEIEGLLAASGFVVESQQGAYRGGPVSPQLPRRILLCRRR
ncbi:MAG: methyltransferase domain-containing protein [Fimbriimonadaceae bacterium]|nr:methyltransferase domain-containing protein [Fimbriimonadaceae bacterium]